MPESQENADVVLDEQQQAKVRRAKKGPSYPALLITQNKHRFYFSTIPVDDLFPSCFVSTRDHDPVSGFQRVLNESRADDIAAYLASGDGSIPSNIVLSAQDVAGLTYSRTNKSISFERVPSAFLVIDGQHRLWGYQKCATRHRVPVAIYEGLTRAEEAKLFIDINTTQRGVPAALLLDIKQVAEVESAREQTLRELFDHLQKDSRSALAGKLSASQSLAGKISRVTFNRALSLVLASATLIGLSAEGKYKLILNYFNAFDAELIDKRYLTKAAYFEAVCELFEEIVRGALAASNKLRQEDLQKIVRPLARLDLSTAVVGRWSKQGLITVMRTALVKRVAISEEML